MTKFENTIAAVIAGDARARSRFETGIEAYRMHVWALRNASEEEGRWHHDNYREDMRYVARRVENVTGFQHGLICDALMVVIREELDRRGEMAVRAA